MLFLTAWWLVSFAVSTFASQPSLQIALIKEQSLKLKNISKLLDEQVELNKVQTLSINNISKILDSQINLNQRQSDILAEQSELIKQQGLYIAELSG